MKNIKYLKILLLLGILLFGFLLRFRNYDKVPFPGESMDEYSYSFVGMSLIKTGMPVGISGIGGYENSESKYINVDQVYQGTGSGNPQTVNWPWFDHPPLLGLITGGYASIKGANNFAEANIYIIRRPMVVIGTVSLLLVMILAWLVFGYKTAAISGLIYASSPIVVVGSRMVQGENGVIPFFLMSLIGIVMYLKNQKLKWLLVSAVSAGVACLFKLSGVAAIIAGLIIIWQSKYSLQQRKKDLWFLAIVSLSVASLYILYGAVYGWEQFWAIQIQNGKRFYGIGPEAIYNLLTQVKVTNTKYLNDPWILSGWIGLLILSAGKKFSNGKRIILTAVFVYLAIYLVMGSYPYGWYGYPFYPMLTISIGNIIADAFNKNKNYLSAFLMLMLPAGYFITKFMDIVQFQRYATYWKFGLAAAVLLLVAGMKTNKVNKNIIKILILITLLAAVYLNYRYINMMTTEYWYKVF